MEWLLDPIVKPDVHYESQSRQHQKKLTKPEGSLGRLEEIAIRLSGMQKTKRPKLNRVWVSVFAGDHGIAAENISVFPQAVTAEMVRNFTSGGAAVNVLSKFIRAHFEAIDVGMLQTLDVPYLIVDKLSQGTANFLNRPAMNPDQLDHALIAGKNAVLRALSKKSDLFIGGEMGIGNTTSATAIACALLKQTPKLLTGAGTGLSEEMIKHKTNIIRQALIKHKKNLGTPLEVLQHLGGSEIAALVGAYIYAAQNQLPVLIDGFIATVAALVAIQINPQARRWFFYAHVSEEKAHQVILDELNVKPLLDLSMRLGEASGAIVAIPILQMACKLHNEMATFKQAQITKK
ncbi:MAG: nicotinate-nucleotide--dimethylbenzimidazole phosphoribosyltransferase [Methylococcales bacterium]|nr:nicotinate-nucleotide--dimethylbenzimidazole phosphoribosyltransferase [Methylococcales bacterium]